MAACHDDALVRACAASASTPHGATTNTTAQRHGIPRGIVILKPPSRFHRGDAENAEAGAGRRLTWLSLLKTWFRLPPRDTRASAWAAQHAAVECDRKHIVTSTHARKLVLSDSMSTTCLVYALVTFCSATPELRTLRESTIVTRAPELPRWSPLVTRWSPFRNRH